MIKDRNFTGVALANIPVDTIYDSCNFGRPDCIDDAGVKKGHRLFPGYDTPRTFIRCNLTNCELPPGSITSNEKNALLERDILLSSEDIVIDGEIITAEIRGTRTYGYYNNSNGQYETLGTPIDRED